MWCVGDTGQEVLERIYSDDFHRSSQQLAMDDQDDPLMQSSPVVENARNRARWLKSLRPGGRLLDVGAGNGYFVGTARRQGFDAEGIDLSAQASAAAHALGVKVHAGDFLRSEEVVGLFDIVTMWDVLCGFPDPHQALARARSLLAPEGLMVATICDRTSIMARLSGRCWPLLIPPVNLHYFSRESMNRLLATHGFSTMSFFHDGKRLSVRFVGQKLIRTLQLAPLERPVARLIPASWQITMNLGDIATVVAQVQPLPQDRGA
jgi:SAM-dependent methyltransferase